MALHEEIRQANFNSSNSAITLLQVFIGEGWNDIMTASVEAGYTIQVLFFLAFVITETLLFTNLLVGILVNAYDAVDGLRKHVQRHGGKVSTRLMTSALQEGFASKRFLHLYYLKMEDTH